MKKKIPFSLDYKEKIESGEVSVVTDSDEPVEIVKWNCKGQCSILAIIDDGDMCHSCFFKDNGSSLNEKDWLYLLVDEEEELTEFEKAYSMLRYGSEATAFFDSEQTKQVKEEAATILEYARRQIEKEKVAQLKETEAYNMGLVEGAAEALKDMPKWKRHCKREDEYFYLALKGEDWYLCCRGYMINVRELFSKLPKEMEE